MGGSKSTAVLRKEYNSLSDRNKQLFLELVTKRGCQTLSEGNFWKNFAVMCDFLENQKGVSVKGIRAGCYTYFFLRKRWEQFGKEHQMTTACKDFYNKVGYAFPADFYDKLSESGRNLSAAEINTRLEAFVKDIFILIANQENSKRKSIVSLESIDNYEWKYFMGDVESGIMKKGRLTNRRRIMLVDMKEDKLELPYVKDTYIYCAVALYYVKNIQERWEG